MGDSASPPAGFPDPPPEPPTQPGGGVAASPEAPPPAPPGAPPTVRIVPTNDGQRTIDYDTLLADGLWETCPYQKQTVPVARIPVADVDPFVRGEQIRLSVNFNKQRSVRAGQADCPAEVLSRITYHCHHGPADETEPEKVAKAAAGAAARAVAALSAGEQGKGKARECRKGKGITIKVGCKAHFVVTVYKADPDTAEIKYLQQTHTGHDVNQQRAYMSDELREWVTDQLHLNLATTNQELQAVNCKRFLAAFRLERPELENVPPSVLREEFLKAHDPPPRDFCLRGKDIDNIRQKILREKFNLSANEAQSVRLLLRRLGAGKEVVMYQEQKVVEKTVPVEHDGPDPGPQKRVGAQRQHAELECFVPVYRRG